MSTTTSRPLALVTGASSGIGLDLALLLAAEGYDLVIAAEDAEITTAAGRLRAAGAHVDVVQVDLATEDGVDELARRVRTVSKPLELAAFNAGIGVAGPFVGGVELDAETAVIDLNVRGTVHIAKRLVPDMVQRGAGRILFTAVAAQGPSAYDPVFVGAGAFVHAFASALAGELTDSGVSVTTLLAGPTGTSFFRRAGIDPATVLDAEVDDDTAAVAREAYEALIRGDLDVVSPPQRSRAQEMVSRASSGLRARLAQLGSEVSEASRRDAGD